MKKKICFVNCSSNGSTGNIIRNIIIHNSDIFDFCCVLGEKSSFVDKEHCLTIGSYSVSYKVCRTETFIFGNDGFLSSCYKHKIERFLKKEKPDIVHIHNAHRSFCNIDSIFNYCLKNNVKIVWTLHDLWAFTGRCCTPLTCNKWHEGCGNCKHKDYFPRTVLDRSSTFFEKKRLLFKKIGSNLNFVSPSIWMDSQIPVEIKNITNSIVINNGIDANVFKPSLGNDLILEKARGRFIVGGAALYFNNLKGRDVFEKMTGVLNPDDYFIVLIGSEKEEIEFPKENVMIMPKTFSVDEMSKFYNSIDVFVNPTQADNYPTTHLESISCGTPVITYDVGGAKEMISEGKTGFAVPLNNFDALINKIDFVRRNQKDFSRNVVSSFSDFSLKSFCSKYRELYLSLLK